MSILRLSNLSLTLAIAVFALAYANPSSAAGKDCDEFDTRPKCNPEPDGGGGDGTMPVTVTFQDGDFYRITSDGKGPYIDDIELVSAFIGHEGSFNLSSGSKNKKIESMRDFKFDFSDCVVAGECDPPLCYDNCISIKAGITGGRGNLSDMQPKNTVKEPLFIVVNLGDENGKIFFLQYDTLNFFGVEPECDSDDADAYRIDANTWVIEAQTACLVRPGGARDPAAVRGVYHMPIKMTVKTK